MKITHAKPLLLTSLDQQIKELGGDGFNTQVQVNPVIDSFASTYTFITPSGQQTLVTRNEITVGTIDGRFVMYHGDRGEYTLVKVVTFKKTPHKLLSVKTLGFSYDNMFEALKHIWPTQIVWKLSNPLTLMN